MEDYKYLFKVNTFPDFMIDLLPSSVSLLQIQPKLLLSKPYSKGFQPHTHTHKQSWGNLEIFKNHPTPLTLLKQSLGYI